MAQLDYDFDSGDITDWSGDIANFVVNNEGQLQLMAAEAGTSYIYTNYTAQSDTYDIAIDFILDMAPSSSNFARIYFAIDNTVLDQANGYYLQLGESGSNDDVSLYKLAEGESSLLAEGSAGSIASDPAQGKICLTSYPDGWWNLSVDYDFAGFCSFEYEVQDESLKLSEANHFGIYCKYTASRKENFYFDNISIQPFEKDREPPSATKLTVLNDQTLQVEFTELIAESSGQVASNYVVSEGFGSPTIASLDKQTVTLSFDQAFSSGINYQLAIMNIADLEGNVMEPIAMPFVVSVPPSVGDLKISEILFNPYTGGSDFVEVYNDSEKYIAIQGLIISNVDKEESKIIQSDRVLLPGEYLCITEDKDFLVERYTSAVDSNIIENDLPSFNNENGNVSLLHTSMSMTVIDTYDYNEDDHFALIDDNNGVSMERISFQTGSEVRDNWHSAASSVGFATPGKKNSNAISNTASGETFSLLNSTFSPNQDGQDDVLVMSYELDKAGYVANIWIYDDEGFEIKQLANNESLGANGIITWDGTDAESNISSLGIYIIVIDLFHPDGDTQNFKKVCVLADFIE